MTGISNEERTEARTRMSVGRLGGLTAYWVGLSITWGSLTRFMRWLMARWSPFGRARLERGHRRLESSKVWLSDRALQRLYGARPA